ncbi:hypothetical protein ACHHYP_07290 [Achlya hypogyna]|uniref:Secreted protein n=1 Tax=Achlya hypogyna TaxID=1202772 RepID=A0A1V9YR00_ACHHY|nr:hypothetical protein ACHHYP_07290 [Achlya hypogyna]
MWTSFGTAVAQLLLTYVQYLPMTGADWAILALRASSMHQVEPTVPIAVADAPAVAAAPGPFHWRPCPDHADDPRYQCGFLTVPLNHLDPANNATLDIAVQKYISNAKSPLGTILLNPGGPGGAGTSMATPDMLAITGGQYDVLGFDPRGIGMSRPIRCSKNGFTAALEAAASENVDVPFGRRAATDADIDSYASNFALPLARCHLYDGDYLPYLSTAFVARDMDLIRAALGQDLMHYYGISYGTFLGATYVNMFPDKVGRMIIDSVLDPEVYTGPTTDLLERSVKDNDEAFIAFTDQCESAGPSLCPLADANATRPYLMSRIQAFLAKVERDPLVVPGGSDIALVTKSQIRSEILGSLYSPHAAWPPLAAKLHQMMTGNYSVPVTNESCDSLDAPLGTGMASIAYIGNDGSPSAKLNWTAALQHCAKIAPLTGVEGFANLVAAKLWTTRPVERYAGPWGKNYTNKVLILNNEVDPATPLVGAKNVHRLMGDHSVLVVREGYGHGAAFSQPSACIASLMVDFYNHGKYPNTTFCKIDATPFTAPPTSAAVALAAHLRNKVLY